MGNQKYNLGGGQFSERKYETLPGTTIEMFGLKCKVIKKVDDITGRNSNIPQYSGTSDVYLILGRDGKPKQLRLFEDHRMSVDFDWGHDHTNRNDGKHFHKGTVHVQSYRNSSTGAADRNSANARYMNNQEMKTIGKIIHHFNPDVKFR